MLLVLKANKLVTSAFHCSWDAWITLPINWLSQDFEGGDFCYGESVLSVFCAFKLVFCEVDGFSSEVDFNHGSVDVFDETLQFFGQILVFGL